MSATTVLARKWRPKTFSQLAGQEHVVQALCNALAQNRLHHAYLFTGTRGVGKTTIARIFAKSLNCASGITATPCGVCGACTEIDSGRFVDLIELDAASNTQVDNMRELLEGAMYAPTSGRFKVYIIDEVHMLSKSAFNAMLKTLEEPPAHVKFILATTDPQKIPVTVLSRCLQFNLKQLPPVRIREHLQYVLEQEKIPCEAGALALLARAAQGSMRDALSLLDQAIAYSDFKVGEETVRSMLGAIDRAYLYDILGALLERDGAGLMRIADNMAARSLEFGPALQDLATLLHRVALVQTVPQAIPDDEPERDRLMALAEQFAAEDIQLYYQIAIHGRDELDLAPDEYAGFTMTLLRMLVFMPVMEQSVPVRPMVSSAAAAGSVTRSASDPSGRVKGELTRAPLKEGGDPARLDWGTLLPLLKIQGMARELAKNCVLESFAEGRLNLLLAPQHKSLMGNKMAHEKLQAALAEYFAQPVRLTISLGEAPVATPAAMEQHQQQMRQQRAEEAMDQDAFVRDARAQLDAQLITDTIKPL